MNSRSAGVAGLQRPRVALAPPADWSHADDAAFLASSYGLTPDEWQFSVLEAWLGARRDGRWSATTCGLAVPRQNGKNAILEIRELYGMVALGEKFLHTAHEVKTARKAFLRLRSFFEDERRYPELAELAVEIRKTNGQEAIVLRNGGSVEFVARSKGSARGYTVDVLVLDEAQELSDEAFEALKPTISAAPTGNRQTILTGTPPAPSMDGEVFTRTRQAALAGQQRAAWHEWSVDGTADLDDRSLWAATNPALGTRLNLEVIEDERATFSDEGFARERLGRWEEPDSGGDGRAINPKAWAALEDESSQAVELAAFAVDVDLGQAWASVAVAGARSDGLTHVEVVEHDRGTRWIVARCQELDVSHGPCRFVVDAGGPARSLIPELEQAGLEVVRLDTRDVAASYGLFLTGVGEGLLRHGPQASLSVAVDSAKSRPCGDGGEAFGRRASGSPISPLTAVSFAYWAAATRPSVNVLNSIW